MVAIGPIDLWATFAWWSGWLDNMHNPRPTTPMPTPVPRSIALMEPVQQVHAVPRMCNLSFQRVYYEYDGRESGPPDGGLVDQAGHMGSIEIKRIEGDRLLSGELGQEFQECKPNPSTPEKTCTFGSLLPAPGDFFTVSFPGGQGSQAISIERGLDTARIFLAEHLDPANPGGCEVGEWRDWQKEEDGKFAFPLKNVKGVKLAKSRVYTCNNFDCSTPRSTPARRGYPIDFRFYD
ncbi:hypothetical protein TWF730_005177 [Orbilia blumenaviensis]|uniref:Uncharacterized protein n=1 Tax=Orbilia blumenaviensis TaxID=1796055 RepID=A0AAV9VJZ0_9PEZI